MPLGPLELYKLLPRTNCGDCHQPSCLAFATQVVGNGYELRECVHLDDGTLADIERQLSVQRQQGVFVKKDSHKITREHLQEKIKEHDFCAIAPGLGIEFTQVDGEDALLIQYFDKKVILTHREIRLQVSGQLDPWDQVLLYNYIFFAGEKPLSTRWVGLESFPNSLSKRAALEEVCHRRISSTFGGHMESLRTACLGLGGVESLEDNNADLAYRFQALPKVPLLLLFWDEDKEEGFDSQTRILFDSVAKDYLDLEGLCFLAEKLVLRLLTKKEESKCREAKRI
ncbi:MAG: DUF3786 domain-containing protein [Deltaproteobacteria bacterium]|nr:DUF3786 domain-containing protein [Deltaproteobacteria bacterium]